MHRKRCLLDTVGHGCLLQLTPEEKVERPIHAVTAISSEKGRRPGAAGRGPIRGTRQGEFVADLSRRKT